MKKITSRNFRILCDFMDIYRFMIDIYEKDWRNGVPAPFLEYALVSDWMDKSKVHRWKIWEDNGVIVGFVFYENPVNDVYFSLRPGYEELADEMVAYADTSMSRVDGYLKFVIFGGQTAIKDAVVIESDTGEYVCYAGMWWIPDNDLAYMEPLCTVPKYRKKGLASAALSEHYRRLKPLGQHT